MYEFAILDHCLEETLMPMQLLKLDLKEFKTITQTTVTQFADEKTRICHSIQHNFFMVTPEHVDRYMTQQVRAVIRLTETLRGFISYARKCEDSSLIEFYQVLSVELDGISSFLLKHFEDFFDFEIAMPYSQTPVLLKSLKDRMETLVKYLGPSEMVTELLEVVFLPLQLYISNPDFYLPYRQYYGYDLLLKALLQIHPGTQDDNNFNIHRVLMFMNYNLPEYVNYAAVKLLWKMESMTAAQKLYQLRWYIKTLKQIEVKDGLSLHIEYPHPVVKMLHTKGMLSPKPEAASAIKQILAWISDEIAFVEYLDNVDKGKHQPSSVAGPKEKIALSLSVAKLAVFVEAFIRTGIFISNDTRSYLGTLRAVARIVHTPGAEELSFDSLRTKAYALRKFKPGVDLKNRRAAINECIELFLQCQKECMAMLKAMGSKPA